jgi:copper homeostasis protein
MRHKSQDPAFTARRRPLVEACVQTIAAAEAAQRAGADRIELCAALETGGVTPGAGVIRTVRAGIGIPLQVLIRPRVGNFVYRGPEVEAMRAEIREARRAGADGVVLGALDHHGRIDREITARLVEAAGPLPVTFHRAFDQVTGQAGALEILIDLGIARVLTSGGAVRAEDGIPRLAELVRASAGRIGILAGGGVRAPGVARLVAETGVGEVHLGPCTAPMGDLDLAELTAVLDALSQRDR